MGLYEIYFGQRQPRVGALIPNNTKVILSGLCAIKRLTVREHVAPKATYKFSGANYWVVGNLF